MVIKMNGGCIGARIEEAANFMGMVTRASQIPFAATACDVIKEEYQWKALVDARYGWRGEIATKCKTKEEVIQMFCRSEGTCIAIPGGGSIVLEIIPHITVVAEARNFRMA